MINHYIPDVYDERVHRLALGLEPIDAATHLPAAPVVRVQVEDIPQPHFRRPQPLGRCLYDDGLPPIDRHPSGRFAVLYSDEPRDPALADPVGKLRDELASIGRRVLTGSKQRKR